MKKFILCITVIFLFLSACQHNESETIAKVDGYTETNDLQEHNITVSPTKGAAEHDPFVNHNNSQSSNSSGDTGDNMGKTVDNSKADKPNKDDKPDEPDIPDKPDTADKTETYIGPFIEGVTSRMQNAHFWIEQYDGSDEIIMTSDKIGIYNETNFENLLFLIDFSNLSEWVNGDEIHKWISELSIIPKSARYNEQGRLYQQQDYTELKNNIDADKIPESINIEYAITVKRTQMRTWPTYKQSYSSSNNQKIDYFTETAVYAAEPVIIYHTSNDGLWYFAAMYNYKGWIPVQDVALCSKEDLMKYQSTSDLLVVNAPVIYTPISSDLRVSGLHIDMGVSLPIKTVNPEGYVVNFPVQDQNTLEFAEITIPFTEDVSDTFLDYNVENIIEQAFKFIGEPYGWGGMNNARDCSSFVADIYRSVGIIFPRNSNQQELMSEAISFSGKSRTERLEILDSLRPGTPLYMPGHAMMYLGKFQQRHYIIHDVTTVYRKENDGKLTAIPLNQVSVTPLDVCNSKGSEYIMLLSTAVEVH